MNGYIITLLSKGAVFQLLFVFLEVNIKDGFIKIACATPDVKVGTVTLSPRGDWRMPSDAKVALWLQDLEQGL